MGRKLALWRGIASRWTFVLAVLLALFTATANSAKAADRPFALRHAVSAQGDIEIIGNTLHSCPSGALVGLLTCENARLGTGATADNSWNMTQVDVDTDVTTFNSSSASLLLPAGSSILKAYLYWGGDLSSDAPDPAEYDNAKFATPASGGYSYVEATTIDGSGGNFGRYQGISDVTTAVQAAGNGTYTMANVQSGSGSDHYAGWALVVMYEDDNQPLRNLTVFDGFQTISGPGVTMTASGFSTPHTGAVTASAGAISYEGDLGSLGDSLSLDGTVLTDALNPANDFFNSTISDHGVAVTTKAPNYPNQLGFDIDQVTADGILTNDQTSADLTAASAGDVLYPGALTLAIDMLAPDMETHTTVDDLDGLEGGKTMGSHTLRYTVEVQNDGQDDAEDSVFHTVLPDYVTYVPGSMNITSGANAGALSDTPSNDQGEYDSGTGTLTVRLGTGANASSGGVLAALNAGDTTLTFEVTVDNDVPDDYEIEVTSSVDVTAATAQVPLTANDSVALEAITRSDLVPTLSNTWGIFFDLPTTFRITVANNGTSSTDGSTVTVTNTMPAGMTPLVTTGSTGWTCNIIGQTITCTRNDILSAGSSYPDILVVADVSRYAASPYVNVATVSGGGDSNASNNEYILSTPIIFRKLSIHVGSNPSSVYVRRNEKVVYTVRYFSRGNANAFNSVVCATAPKYTKFVSLGGGKKIGKKKVCWKIGTLVVNKKPWGKRKFAVRVDGNAPKTRLFSYVMLSSTNAPTARGYRVIRTVGILTPGSTS